jgi:hypothetical protein
MAEQLIILAPGEERVIRIRCGGEAAIPPNAPVDQVVEEQVPPNTGPEPVGLEENIPAGNLPNAPPAGLNYGQGEGNMANRRNNRKTRKNRKENGATRKNRKQSGGNSYMNFAKNERSKVLSENPEMKSNVVAVAKEIGKRWRALSESERKKY